MAWEGVFGHRAQCGILDTFLSNPKHNAAFIFSGPPGIGKKLIARELSRKYLCDKRGDRGCACKACTVFYAGGHPDFHEHDLSKIPVDHIRELFAGIDLPPYGEKSKVVVLENVDLVHHKVPSVLLKPIEEPNRSIFILLAKSLENISPAIRSRCFKLTFSELSDADMTQLADSLNLAREGRELAIELSNGQAAELLSIDVRVVERLKFSLMELAEHFNRGDKIGLIKLVDILASEKLFPQFTAAFQLAIRSALRNKAGIFKTDDKLVSWLACLRKDVLFEVETWLDEYGNNTDDYQVLLTSCFLKLVVR